MISKISALPVRLAGFISFLLKRKAKLPVEISTAIMSDTKFLGNRTVYIAGTLIYVAYASTNCEFHYFGSISI